MLLGKQGGSDRRRLLASSQDGLTGRSLANQGLSIIIRGEPSSLFGW